MAAPTPADDYVQFRGRILNLDPADLSLAPTAASPYLWGVIVEMGYEVGSVSLVALADGTTSLHYSTGGGLLGKPGYAPLAEASRALVTQAEKFLQHASLSQDLPLPQVGQVRFILLTYSGTYAIDTDEKSLATDGNLFAPLYKNALDTLSQLRLLAEKNRK